MYQVKKEQSSMSSQEDSHSASVATLPRSIGALLQTESCCLHRSLLPPAAGTQTAGPLTQVMSQGTAGRLSVMGLLNRMHSCLVYQEKEVQPDTDWEQRSWHWSGVATPEEIEIVSGT